MKQVFSKSFRRRDIRLLKRCLLMLSFLFCAATVPAHWKAVAQQKATQQEANQRAGEANEEQEWERLADCVNRAIKTAEEKRAKQLREGKTERELRGIFSLWHGRRKTMLGCVSPVQR